MAVPGRRAGPIPAVLVLCAVLCASYACVGAAAAEEAEAVKGEAAAEAEEMACYDGCSGHGRCVAFSCECELGWQGEACNRPLMAEDEVVLPWHSAGHGNLTVKGWRKLVKRSRREGAVPTLVAVSTASCVACLRAEGPLMRLKAELDKQGLGIKLQRVDLANTRLRQLVDPSASVEVPALLAVRKGKLHAWSKTIPVGESGVLAAAAWARQLAAPVSRPVADLKQLCATILNPSSLDGAEVDKNTVVVVMVGGDEDDGADWLENAEASIGVDASVVWAHLASSSEFDEEFSESAWTPKQHVLAQSLRPKYIAKVGPFVVMYRSADVEDSGICSAEDMSAPPASTALGLASFYGESSILDWVRREALPMVGPLTPSTYAMYESLSLPMLILFLDMSENIHARYAQELAVMEEAASRFSFHAASRRAWDSGSDRIAFVYCDGQAFASQMRSLGLGPGTQLPAAAFNVRDGRVLSFREGSLRDVHHVVRFCDDFLGGRLKDERLAHSTEKVAPATKEQKGVRELFHAADDQNVMPITAKTWPKLALDDTTDVLVLLHSAEDADSMAVAPYYKRVGKRFRELALKGVRVARFDLGTETPPPGLSLQSIPAILLLPAHDKEPPFKFYSGVAKVLPLMRWVEKHSGNGILLGDLPQFDAEDKKLFKEQIVEREQRRVQKMEATNNDGTVPSQPQQQEPQEKVARKTKGKKQGKKKNKKARGRHRTQTVKESEFNAEL